MLYAAIIIVALAVALVIVLRRLPEMNDPSNQAQPPLDSPTARSSIPKAPGPSVKFKLPAFDLSAITGWFSKLSLPKMPARKPRTATKLDPLPSKGPAEVTPKQSGDFWAEAEREPTAPTATAKQPSTEATREEEPAPQRPLIEKRPKTKDLFQEAEDLFAVKDHKRAEKLYLKLATEDPKNPKIYSRLGIIYLEQKAYEDARDALQQAIKLEPNVASRHYNLAMVYLNLESKSKAINSMESALKYDPGNRKYRKMLDDIIADRA